MCKWLDKYEWLVYSIKESGVFCKYCAIFANLLPKKRNLINRPKNKGWKDSTAEFNKHSTSTYKKTVKMPLLFEICRA